MVSDPICEDWTLSLLPRWADPLPTSLQMPRPHGSDQISDFLKIAAEGTARVNQQRPISDP